MSTVAERTSAEELELEKRGGNAIAFALGVAALSLLLGAALFYTWNWAFAATFTFTKPIASYWTAVLVVIGLYVVMAVLKSAWNMMTYKVFDSGKTIDDATPIAVLLGLAYLVHLFV